MSGIVPVIFIFFKRRSALKVLEGIRTYAPGKLFLIADGGRTENEHEQCLIVRKAVEDAIDWPCEIHKLYSETNLGCRTGIPRGLNFVFNQVDNAIILEDDCVPENSFFPFCEEMLARYATDTRIWTISGTNFFPTNSCFGDYSYLFSGYSENTGWATWRRAWTNYDNDMSLWSKAKLEGVLKGTFLSPEERLYWEAIFQQVFDHTISSDPWDYQWLFKSWCNNALSIVPRVNLISNIGFHSEATHTLDPSSPLANAPLRKLQFPIRHPPFVVRNAGFDFDYGRLVFYGYNKTFRRKVKEVLMRIVVPKARPLLRGWYKKLHRVPLVRFGSLRRLTPVSRVFGSDRGTPIDRYYIESFLTKNTQDIHGHVLEIGDDSYTRKFGGERVINSSVLHVTPGNPQATLVGDLETGAGIPASAFDCMILTQTFQFIYEVNGAIANAYAALKPGGVLLVTFPGISQISRYEMDCWRFTTLSARKLFGEVFPTRSIKIEAHGNVLIAMAFLHGFAAEELQREELDYHDPDYEVLITVRAVKPMQGEC